MTVTRKPCRECGAEKPPGERWIYCDNCRPIYETRRKKEIAAAAAKRRKRNKEKVNQQDRERNRKPCLRCHKPKPPGERRRLCDDCRVEAKIEQSQKQTERTRRYYAEHREEALKSSSDWEKTPAGRASHLLAITRKRYPNCEVVDRFDPLEIFIRDKGRCGICGELVDMADYTIDHILALSNGGEHSRANAQIAHHKCNASKGRAEQHHAQRSKGYEPDH